MSQDILPSNIQSLLIQSLGDLEPMVLTKEHPVLDRIDIQTDASGLGDKQPILTGWGGGVSGTFEDSLANAKVNAANTAAFSISPAILYGNAIIDWSSSRYTKGKSSAIDVSILGTKSAMENATDNFCSMIFGDGSGTLARIRTATNTSGTKWKLKLYNPIDVGKFQVDYKLVSKLTPFAAALDAGTGSVTGLGQMGGFLMIDTAGSGWTPTAGHYLGLSGQMLASTDIVTFPGIFGYVPPIDARDSDGVPNVTTFLGVDRGTESPGVAVSGWAFNIKGQPTLVGMNTSAGYMSNYKDAKPTVAFCNGADLPRLAIECETKVRFDMPSKKTANVFYQGFEVGLSTGKCEVLAEPACPAGNMVLANPDMWYVKSPGKLFAPATNGQIMVPSYEKNRSRCSVEVSGFFTTSNPPATAVLKLY